MRFSFANRLHEIQQIRRFAGTSSTEERLCIVAGASGIGKSRLVDESLADQENGPFVRVRIKEADFRCGESGFFLREVALAVADYQERAGGRLKIGGFVRRNAGLATIRKALGAAARKVEKATTGGDEATSDTMTTWRDETASFKDLLGEPSVPALRLAAKYLSHVLREQSVILAIENAQLIDAESIHYLHEIVGGTPASSVVYEFTASDGIAADSRPSRTYSQFQSACATSHLGLVEIELSPIDFDVLAQANFDRSERRYVETLRAEFATGGGNVRDVERLHEIVGRRIDATKSVGVDAIARELSKLSSAQKIVLWIIALSGDDLDGYELTDICAFVPEALRPAAPVDIATSLSPFIEVRNGLLGIDHDSLSLRLDSMEFLRREQLVAAHTLSEYLRHFLVSGDFRRFSEYELLFGLLGLNVVLRSSDLLDFAISRLANRARVTGRPSGLLRLVTAFAHGHAGNIIHARTMSALIRILYDACWIQGAVELTSEFKREAFDIWLCHCQALSFSGRHDQANAEVSALRVAVRDADVGVVERRRFSALVNLTDVLVTRLRGDYEDAHRKFIALSVEDFVTDAERCLYHRYAEVAGANDAIQHLTIAYQIAQLLRDPSHSIRTSLSLALIKAEASDLDEASALLKGADAAGPTSYVDVYMIANNRLVVGILGRSDWKPLYSSLAEALPLVVDTMDRILITNNLLAAAVLSGDNTNAIRLAQQLEAELPKIVEGNIQRISYFNCSRFHERCGARALAQTYWEEAFRSQLGFDEVYWGARSIGSIDSQLDVRLSVEFDLPMMTNWYFTLPSFEELTETVGGRMPPVGFLPR